MDRLSQESQPAAAACAEGTGRTPLTWQPRRCCSRCLSRLRLAAALRPAGKKVDTCHADRSFDRYHPWLLCCWLVEGKRNLHAP